jgi:hypothetical protein
MRSKISKRVVSLAKGTQLVTLSEAKGLAHDPQGDSSLCSE